MKYEMIFGDPSQFEGMMLDCEFVDGNYGYKNNRDIFYYCERYNEKFGWEFSHKTNLEFRPIAMRRIIKEPKHWTWEDKEAGRLPDVGCVVMVIGVNEVARIAAINNDSVCVVFEDGGFITLHFSGIEPIETPAKKAQRLRDEWCANVRKNHPAHGHVTVEAAIYDALLSGELQAPKGGE